MNIRINLMLRESIESLRYIFVADSRGLQCIFIQIFVVGSVCVLKQSA